jgi:hypothetical protein
LTFGQQALRLDEKGDVESGKVKGALLNFLPSAFADSPLNPQFSPLKSISARDIQIFFASLLLNHE